MELGSFDDVYPPVVERAAVIRHSHCVHPYVPHHSAGYNLTFALLRVLSELWPRDDADHLQLAEYCLVGVPPDVAGASALLITEAILDTAEVLAAGAMDAPPAFRRLAERIGGVDARVRTAVMARLGEYFVGFGLSALADVTYVGDAPPNAQDWVRVRDVAARIVAEIRHGS